MLIFLTVIGGVFYASLLEWLLHRFVMHRPLGPFTYPFERHALLHHRIFRADHTYHLTDEKDKHTIPMAWWNGPVLVLIATLPVLFISWWLHRWSISIAICLVIAAYYGTYEYLHWCMHLPKRRRVEMSWLFFRLNGHHLLHHRYMNRNFNVVLPLADFCLGTLLLRSKFSFAQATGEPVPNVQPM